MSLRVGNIISKMVPEEADAVNQNFDDLFRVKAESILVASCTANGAQQYESGNFKIRPYQEFVHGEIWLSANGSGALDKNILIKPDIPIAQVVNVQTTLLFADDIGSNTLELQTRGIALFDTQATILVQVKAHPFSGGISGITTACFSVMWRATIAQQAP